MKRSSLLRHCYYVLRLRPVACCIGNREYDAKMLNHNWMQFSCRGETFILCVSQTVGRNVYRLPSFTTHTLNRRHDKLMTIAAGMMSRWICICMLAMCDEQRLKHMCLAAKRQPAKNASKTNEKTNKQWHEVLRAHGASHSNSSESKFSQFEREKIIIRRSGANSICFSLVIKKHFYFFFLIFS